jgi:hypothetical protein
VWLFLFSNFLKLILSSNNGATINDLICQAHTVRTGYLNYSYTNLLDLPVLHIPRNERSIYRFYYWLSISTEIIVMFYTTEIVIALSYQSIEKYFMVKMTIKLKKNNMTVCAWHIKSLIVASFLGICNTGRSSRLVYE